MLSADGGNRTPDRRVTKPLLYQLSYISKIKPVESELVAFDVLATASPNSIETRVRRVISRPSSVQSVPS